MTLLSDLLAVYENNAELAGQSIEIPQKNGQTRTLTLIPPLYTEISPALIIPIDEQGRVLKNSIEIRLRQADQTRVIVPATMQSITRTSHLYPHLISDQLRFVVPQLADCVGGKAAKDIETLSAEYLAQLKDFIQQESLPGAQAVYESVTSGNLFNALVDTGILLLDEAGRLQFKVKKSDKNMRLEGLSALTKMDDILTSFVQFEYQPATRGLTLDDYFLTNDMVTAVQDFSLNQQKEPVQHSLMTGKRMPSSLSFPKSLIIGQANAKLISANDENNYAGYFQKSTEGASIGGIETFKSLNALRWLIRKQGITYSKGQYVILIWTDQGSIDQAVRKSFNTQASGPVPMPYGLSAPTKQAVRKTGTGQRTAATQRRALKGLRKNANRVFDAVHLLELRVATSGRISVANYQTTEVKYFVDLVNRWYQQTSWPHILSGTRQLADLITPSPAEIVQVGVGIGRDGVFTNENPEAVRYLQEIAQCIRQGGRLPRNTVTRVVTRVVQSTGYSEKRTGIPWERALEVACAVWRNYEGGNGKTMLDENNHDRSYLFGRLLALADQIEDTALYQKQSGDDNSRRTNAFNLMQQFGIRPYTTWNVLMDRIHPYLGGLTPVAYSQYQSEIATVMALFQDGDYNDERLTPDFLMGYYLQTAALINQRRERAAKKKQEQE
ncbi:MAG: type I-C CRISPR-associated protein Cas8c/Csd1 [Schleiferilactobacillus perolens]|uniref:type I-C CRISPR-associated protein Cas8c/Csd1 n=1 Tax=Schleiferilactobacillus perolens TaxID=100468 RepID=UPI0039E7A819